MGNLDIAELIGELSTSTDNASVLVKGLVQASINAGLQADIGAYQGYAHFDRTGDFITVSAIARGGG